MARAVIGAAFLILGAVTFVISVLGVYRFRYVLNRLHASAIADTLGTLLTVIGLLVLRGFSFASVKLIIIVIALWVTGPVCTNRIAEAEINTDGEYRKHSRSR